MYVTFQSYTTQLRQNLLQVVMLWQQIQTPHIEMSQIFSDEQ